MALAIRWGYRGSLSLPQGLALTMMAGRFGAEAEAARAEELTRGAVEVVKCVAQGKSNAEIAQALSISVPTVHSHVHNVLDKLNLSSRTQAALYAVEIGLVIPQN